MRILGVLIALLVMAALGVFAKSSNDRCLAWAHENGGIDAINRHECIAIMPDGTMRVRVTR